MADGTLAEAILLFRRGRTRRARELLADVLARYPKNYLALSFAGLLDALHGEDLAAAEETCFRAAMMAPNDAQLHSNLAWVQILAGRRRAACESVSEALARDPRNADARRIQRSLGRRRRPAVSVLARGNAVNRLLGRALSRLRPSEA